MPSLQGLRMLFFAKVQGHRPWAGCFISIVLRSDFARREVHPGGREGQGALPPGCAGCAQDR